MSDHSPNAESDTRYRAVRSALALHTRHAGSGGGKWWCECLGPDCAWEMSGEGGYIDAFASHADHVTTEVLAALDTVTSPGQESS